MTVHISVLPEESIENLNIKEGSVVVDATLGGGGHSLSILEKIGDKGKLIAIDVDEDAIGKFKSELENKKIEAEGRVFLIRDNFKNIGSILDSLKIGKVDAILADLGYSSDQLENAQRGMSFLSDAPLDMRLDRDNGLSAEKVVNEYSEAELERVFREYGEEKFSRRIAKGILEARKKKRIGTTLELAGIIEKNVPSAYAHGHIHPATRVFQAIRIEVNNELENLKIFLDSAIGRLNEGGRIGVISFHSLEDRIIKEGFKENAGGCICPDSVLLEGLQKEYLSAVEQNDPSAERLEKDLRKGFADSSHCVCGRVRKIKIITKKPIVPGEDETRKNPRSRSAKLRVAEKI
ncbi:MAG: 16S rRNA (cytosine(1402)-N(4))-methyltransferase RsmH [Candidatus Moranbacteria bacterium]|nr:16S rRNA (cytosine(1402)-N(4))-methyltransferase RsmH [Candidatus Moranbacteria bacterium]